MTELTILMPCLNEAETLEICILKAQQYFDRSGVSGEVLISDNGSTDGSQQIAEDLGARVVHALLCSLAVHYDSKQAENARLETK